MIGQYNPMKVYDTISKWLRHELHTAQAIMILEEAGVRYPKKLLDEYKEFRMGDKNVG